MENDKPKPVYTPPPPPVEVMATVGEVTALANQLAVVVQHLERLQLHLAPLIGLDERFATSFKTFDERLRLLEDPQRLAWVEARLRLLEDPQRLAWVEARLKALEARNGEDAQGAK